MKIITKIGIADAHGIESYCDETERQLGIFTLRASLNKQSHAVAYIAVMSEKIDKKMRELLKESQFIKALKYLKKNATHISLTNGNGMSEVNDSWNLIPNPKLDPYN